MSELPPISPDADQARARSTRIAPASPLFMLAFDHRRSLRDLPGLVPDRAGEAVRIADAKRVIFGGLLRAQGGLAGRGIPGLLVDEEFGSEVLELARSRELVAAVACERSGQVEFELEYGDDFGAHIERFEPELVKVLVRFNPDADPSLNHRQLDRLRTLSGWLRASNRRLLFELLVPPEPRQLRDGGGSRERFDTELRPQLVSRAIVDLQDAGIEPAVWKIEGIEAREWCRRIAATCRRDRRDGVSCLILGRGADQARVEHWLRVAAPVDGFAGFAVGRTIWWEAIGGYLTGEIDA